jgi:hypothetical protein
MDQVREHYVIYTLNQMEEGPGKNIRRLMVNGLTVSDLDKFSAEDWEEYRAIIEQDMEDFQDELRRILAGETVERDWRWDSDEFDEYDESRRRVHRVQRKRLRAWRRKQLRGRRRKLRRRR